MKASKLYPLLLMVGTLVGQSPQTNSALGPDTPAQMQLVVPTVAGSADGTPKPVAWTATAGISITAPSIYQPSAVWSETVDANGVYIATFTDPENHWRCVIASTQPARPGNVIHTELAAFTVTCYDTNLSTVPAPTPKGAKP